MTHAEVLKLLGPPLEGGDPSPLAADIADTCKGLLTLDLPESYGRKVDQSRKPRRGTSAEIRRWWCSEFRRVFEGTAISGGRAAGQFTRLVTHLGGPEDTQKFLEFVLDRWPEIKNRWGLVGTPDPGLLLGWKHRIIRAMQTGDIPRLSDMGEGEGELEEWS